jgi:hypothetical protein
MRGQNIRIERIDGVLLMDVREDEYERVAKAGGAALYAAPCTNNLFQEISFAVSPGRHVLAVHWMGAAGPGTEARSTKPVLVEFEAMANARYMVCARTQPDRTWSAFIESDVGDNPCAR